RQCQRGQFAVHQDLVIVEPVVENARSAANRRLRVAEHIPGETEPRRNLNRRLFARCSFTTVMPSNGVTPEANCPITAADSSWPVTGSRPTRTPAALRNGWINCGCLVRSYTEASHDESWSPELQLG